MARITDTANSLSAGAWAADFIKPEDLMPGGAMVDVAQFYNQDSVLVTVATTTASGNTSIPVVALSGPLPTGTLLDFGGAGAKPVKLTAPAVAGAVTITVASTLAGVTAGDTARYTGAGVRKKVIESGYLIGRTTAERVAGTHFGPWAAGDDEVYLVAFDKPDLSLDPTVDLVRPGFAVYDNLLPNYTEINTAQNEVQTVVVAGTLSAGTYTLYDPRSGKTSRGVAYNGNLAAIQVALDDIYGASNTVAAGTVASFTITFAVALAGIEMPLIVLDPDGLTGATSVTVTETTKGGKPSLDVIRSLYRCTTGYN